MTHCSPTYLPSNMNHVQCHCCTSWKHTICPGCFGSDPNPHEQGCHASAKCGCINQQDIKAAATTWANFKNFSPRYYQNKNNCWHGCRGHENNGQETQQCKNQVCTSNSALAATDAMTNPLSALAISSDSLVYCDLRGLLPCPHNHYEDLACSSDKNLNYVIDYLDHDTSRYEKTSASSSFIMTSACQTTVVTALFSFTINHVSSKLLLMAQSILHQWQHQWMLCRL